MKRRAFLGLGSNLGDRWALLGEAVAGLPDLAAVSSVYETDPVGGPPGQGPYLNLVAELDTALAPRGLLAVARKCESRAGRVRSERFGPRTLDVDVLVVGDLVVDEADLVVPHPRMWERRFVLEPLSELVDVDQLPATVLPESWVASTWRGRVAGKVHVAGRLEMS